MVNAHFDGIINAVLKGVTNASAEGINSVIQWCREQARGVYYGAVFEIKKEIPVDKNRDLA